MIYYNIIKDIKKPEWIQNILNNYSDLFKYGDYDVDLGNVWTI